MGVKVEYYIEFANLVILFYFGVCSFFDIILKKGPHVPKSSYAFSSTIVVNQSKILFKEDWNEILENRYKITPISK